MLEKENPVESVQELWEETSMTILRVGEKALSIRAGRRPPGDKDTSWWDSKVQEVITANTEARQMWEIPGRQEDRDSDRLENNCGKESSSNSQGAGNERVVRGAGNTGG